MNWAARRRLTIGLIIGGIVLVGLVVFSFATFYRAPSCSDGKRNQGESGVDCGGSCAYVCTADAIAPRTLFANLIHTKNGRTDLVATIENRNGDLAAKDVPFTISLHTSSGTLVKEVSGTLDLPPRTAVPLFIPGVLFAGQGASRAFVEIAPEAPRWYTLARDPRIIPLVEVKPLGGLPEAPRVEATLSNPSLTLMARVPVVAFVRDTVSGNVIAASQTVLQTIAPQGAAPAIFTWNEAFTSPSVRIEIVPVIALP